MRISLLSLFFLSLIASPVFGQETKTGISTSRKVFKPYLAGGMSLSYSVINNRKEPRGQYKPGVNVNANFYTSPWFSVSGEYTWFFTHSASPAFENIHSWNTEVNGNVLMGIGQTSLMFKALFGVSYMNWSGTFIGPSLNDNNKYSYGMVVKQDWIAGNLGCGMLHPLNKNINASFDFRMRFASEKNDLLSISDTAFLLGIQWKITDSEEDVRKKSSKGKRKTSGGRSGRMYKWLKKGA
jgi:hypothetical protein